MPGDLDTDDAPTRLYVAMDGRDVVGCVSSVRVGPLGASVVNLFVAGSARRRGLGRALMSAALADDERLGIQASVLTASNDNPALPPTRLPADRHRARARPASPMTRRPVRGNPGPVVVMRYTPYDDSRGVTT